MASLRPPRDGGPRSISRIRARYHSPSAEYLARQREPANIVGERSMPENVSYQSDRKKKEKKKPNNCGGIPHKPRFGSFKGCPKTPVAALSHSAAISSRTLFFSSTAAAVVEDRVASSIQRRKCPRWKRKKKENTKHQPNDLLGSRRCA